MASDLPAGPAPADGTPENWLWRDGPRSGRAVVFDIDGVLANAEGRQHFLRGGRKDWDGFFAASADDPLIDDVARLVPLLDDELVVVLLTGRPLGVQAGTSAWLARHGLRWDLLIMRDEGDYQAALEFKRRTIAELRGCGLQLELGFEDDRRNADMFRDEGVPCIYIHSGYYET